MPAIIGLGLALALTVTLAHADWPTRPIRVIVPFPAGGGVDANARLIAPLLSQALGQPVMMENKPGAAGNLALGYVADTPADGYTLLWANVGVLTINPFLYPMKHDPRTALAPIGLVVKNPFVLWTSTTMPGEDWSAFVKAAKAQPGTYNFASGGSGTSNHLCTELVKRAAGIEMPHIPYKGGAPAMVDLLAGRVHGYCDVYSVGAPYLADGRLKALAVTSAQRLAVLPGVPTLIELGMKDIEITGWQGVLAPAGTPRTVIEKLAAALQRIVESEAIRNDFARQGVIAAASTPAEFGALIASETLRWGKLVKETGARAE
ncbi:tripartite tricarboxylate transporter substrate binding protein [Variovorax sp. OV329]|uniref:Bug family tripartite tricarboxylate transporter substrate binding protein n=1 Tax=Variovorax sp. OV329 TaxID=1882825 RepID=UPI0008E9D100|nr:tripartite tricarboxylate transporter substrate binding protein [Variovorax sp. OV329]SFN52190.1 Tripartite-type tricarboxylate transporter, receptor component TctC [Variovorax sp. OV329]